jgi:Cu+-exporting ATPase
LISLGVGAAFIWSLWVLLFANAHGMEMNGPQTYFEVAASVPVFILAGRWFEVRAKYRSSSALRALMDLSVPEVSVLRGGVEEVVGAEDVQVGDVFVVRPGDRIATDGVVESGASCIDESLLTGESLPIDVSKGSQVTGGTMNIDGRLVVRALRVGSDTRLAQVARLVVAAQMGKAPIQRLADRISAIFVPIVILVSVATLATWWFITYDGQAAFTAAVAVLIIACPCALGLATPIALLVGTGRGAQIGILIRGPQVLEDTRRVNTIVLDKTGTVTMGAMSVLDVAADDVSVATVLQLAASVEIGSEHPVARAIVTAAGFVNSMTDFSNVRGAGVRAKVGNEQITVGRPVWVAEQAGSMPSDHLALRIDAWGDLGATVVVVAQGARIIGAIAIADEIRPTSARAVTLLGDLGLRPVLLTGDHERAARAVAQQVGIVDVVADVRPEDKVAHVTALQNAGAVVAMVGDGVNDAAALATADLGIAMGSGSDVAVEASDLTLVRSDLLAAVDAIRLSRRTLAIIRGNLFWAFAYNVAMIPLAAAGLLNPMLAGAAMASSSVFVVANSLRLRLFARTA